MVDPRTRADLAVRGINAYTPVRRHGGAGPTGDGHLLIDGIAAAVPTDPASPYRLEGGRLVLDGEDQGVDVTAVERPAFYDQVTSDGVAMHRLARLHGADVLATTVVQTCIRYRPEERCRYCSIEESLAAGATTRVKTPSQLAEVAAAAVALDGVTQMVMTTGTSATPDRGARYLARCVEAVKATTPGLPIQVQCEPPDDPGALAALRRAGADAIGIHVESLDDDCRRRWLPGKARVPLSAYWAAWDEAVVLFGANRVSTYLLAGLGEDPRELVEGASRLIEHGVYPFVVPVRPGAGTLAAAAGLRPPDAAMVAQVSTDVAGLLAAASMHAGDQRAGCAACGACSALGSAAPDEVPVNPGRTLPKLTTPQEACP
ncbi:MAG: MSMEG_0568 family radical SAM protein [Actinomycetota bacterium]|nr:MSMEG_0568 family radical SAM protein [Actinomycetota bacterium]